MRIGSALVTGFVCLAASSSGARAQSLHPDSVFDRLAGQWVMRGIMRRQPTVHDITFTWLLGREYLQMHEVSREKNPDGTPQYEAIVLFGRNPETGVYGALWLDNTGTSDFDPAGTGHGKVAGDSLPFLFHYSATTSFHNTFVYHRSPESWEMHLDNDSAGVRRPFARLTLTRP